MFGRRKRPKPVHPDLPSDLRSAARRLTGWTVEGSSGVDIERLLDRAADEIENLHERIQTPSDEDA